jgi:hypothetical protein
MITAVMTCGVFGSLKIVTQSSRRVSDNERCRIDLSQTKGRYKYALVQRLSLTNTFRVILYIRKFVKVYISSKRLVVVNS